MKKILITGAFGQLGAACLDRFENNYEILATGRRLPEGNFKGQVQQLDITDFKAVERTIESFEPDVVLNLAAMTNVDLCERQPEEALAVNTKAVQHLQAVFQGHLIQLSTDYVFDGRNGPYSESDSLNPLNVYGRTKAEADIWLLDQGKEVTILRANVIFDVTPETRASFVKWVLDSLKAGKQIQVVEDQINNPTWTVALAEVIDTIIQQGRTGLYHYGGKELLSRYAFALKIADIFNLQSDLIKPVLTSNFRQEAKRPLQSGLCTEKVEKELGLQPYPVETCLRKIRLRMHS
jgi:dTDP-4-dehydrorhamnose reductase